MSDHTVGEFFDSLTGEYTETIERCFPRYSEMLWALLNYLPDGRQFERILELGCGTGNLSVVLHETFPNANLRVVDISAESLDFCRSADDHSFAKRQRVPDPRRALVRTHLKDSH